MAEVSVTRAPITSASIATTQVNALVNARERALAQLRAITPPSQDKNAYQAFLAAYPAIESDWRAGEAKAVSSFPVAGYNLGATPQQALQTSGQTNGLASKAGLNACAGKLPAGDVSTLTTEIRQSQLHPTASLCTVFSTPRFVVTSGGRRACLKSTKTYSTSATVSGLRGTLPEAVGFLTRSGGNQPGGRLIFWLVKQGGQWAIDDAAAG